MYKNMLFWVFYSNTLIFFVTYKHIFLFHQHISLIFSPNIKHSWLETTNIFHSTPLLNTFMNEFYDFFINSIDTSLVGATFLLNYMCATAWCGLQSPYFNCWLIFVYKLPLVFVLTMEISRLFHIFFFACFKKNYIPA